MKKIIIISIFILFILNFVSCKNDSNYETITDSKGEEVMNLLELKIEDSILNVTWENNSSVEALKALANNGLSISMHKYSNFEQVGSIGYTLPSNDKRIKTIPGDIVLYSSNQIVIFYGSNTWEYTKLGHINLDAEELKELLGNNDVNITIKTK